MEATRVVFLDAGDTRPGAVGVRLRQLMGGRGATTLRTLAGQDRRSADPARRMRPTRLPVGGALSCRGAAIGRDAPCAGPLREQLTSWAISAFDTYHQFGRRKLTGSAVRGHSPMRHCSSWSRTTSIHGMIALGDVERGSQVSPAPDRTLADPQQIIAELQRELAECRAERDEALRKLDERKTERDEAFAREAAMAEVLQVINSSPGDLAPVLDAVLEKAVRLSEAVHGHLWRCDGEVFYPLASHGDPRFAQWFAQRGPVRPRPEGDGFLTRVLKGERVLYMADIRESEGYRAGTTATALADIGGCRSVLTIALRKDDAVLGAMTVYRQEVRPFSDKQIALLENFAAQAVIAMENARLLG